MSVFAYVSAKNYVSAQSSENGQAVKLRVISVVGNAVRVRVTRYGLETTAQKCKTGMQKQTFHQTNMCLQAKAACKVLVQWLVQLKTHQQAATGLSPTTAEHIA